MISMIIMIIMLIMLSMIIIYGYRDWTNDGFDPPSAAPQSPDLSKSFPRPAHWMRSASTKHLRPRTPLIPERTQGAQVHRSHPLQNSTRISQDGNARINWNRTPPCRQKMAA